MNCQKCIEKIANIAKITNSTRIAKCSKTLLQISVAILGNTSRRVGFSNEVNHSDFTEK